MSNEIKYNKLFTLGGLKEVSIPERSKEEIINDIKTFPAVVLRGHLDHLIQIDRDSEEPKFIWNLEALNTMDIYPLLYLLTFIKKRYEAELKKGVLSKPITKHTYS